MTQEGMEIKLETLTDMLQSSFGAWRVQMEYERAFDHLSTFTCQRNEYLNSLNDCITCPVDIVSACNSVSADECIRAFEAVSITCVNGAGGCAEAQEITHGLANTAYKFRLKPFEDSTEVSMEISRNRLACGEESGGTDILILHPSSAILNQSVTVSFHYEASS